MHHGVKIVLVAAGLHVRGDDIEIIADDIPRRRGSDPQGYVHVTTGIEVIHLQPGTTVEEGTALYMVAGLMTRGKERRWCVKGD